MYLSKLEIFGFKSFAQKTNLKFTDGISCVIGPNGSGKSNIVDAIRWVLGEQKVSNLRSDRMEELIFNGSNNHKPLGMAEVSLTVQNNKNILDTPYSEVVVSRRLYRSGESQYLINKSPCRLKDLIDLFMDTGMGANSYSVIELRMVENIISDNPSERRHLFEEAAGVTKYKARRKSALRKLELTRQDMSRISDLISEIQRNVTSLSRQVGKARRYLSMKEELKKLELDVAKFRYTHLIDAIQPLKTQLNEISRIKEDTSHQITLEEALLEEYKREIIQIEQNLGERNKKLQNYDAEINQLKEEEAVAQTRLQSLNETKRRNKIDIEEYQEKANKLNIDLSEQQNKLKEIQSSLGEFKNTHKDKDEKFTDAKILLEKEKTEIDKLNLKHKSINEGLMSKKEIAQQKIYLIDWNKEQIEKIEIDQRQSENLNKQLSEKILNVTKTRDNANKDLSKLESQIKTVNEELDSLEQKIQNKSNEIQSILSKKERILTQIQFYEEIISKFEGHTKSTQYLMLNNKDYPGLHGPLSDLLKVDQKYKVAVETALGEAVNYVVVENVETAKNILQVVNEKKLGRVTLLPLDRINDIAVKENNVSGNFSQLSKLITCQKEYQKIFQLLLGDFVIVEDFEKGLIESKINSNLHFVSLKGEIINRKGILSGGQESDQKTSLIGRNEQMNDLRNQISSIDDIEKQVKNNFFSLQNQKNMKHSQLEEFEKNKEQLLRQLLELDKSLSQLTFEKQSQTDLLQKVITNLSNLEKTISDLESDYQNLNPEISQKEQELSEVQEEITEATSSFNINNKKLQELSEELQKVNLNLVNEQNRYTNCQMDITRLEQNIIELKDLSEKRTKEINEIAEQCENIENEKVKRIEKQKRIWDERDRVESEKEEIQQTYHEIKDKILHLEEQVKRFRKQHDSSLERSRQLELQIQENQIKANTLFEQTKNKYNLDITTGIPYEGLDLEDSEQRIETLTYKIEQLGQVNPLAVSEHEKESERLEFYTKQYNDLDEAEKSLLTTINKINTTARKQFVETFNKINENFTKIFCNFFENGDGFLKIEDSKDPLESNIEIFVRPKGKRVQTISLLSGGEKTLTAISLLFSIYLVKPSPFCILDEIDAPLDDVNVDRFTKALSQFSKNTQFLVVTHNKRTMESANTLYGVTMEDEGLSKLVSVKFN